MVEKLIDYHHGKNLDLTISLDTNLETYSVCCNAEAFRNVEESFSKNSSETNIFLEDLNRIVRKFGLFECYPEYNPGLARITTFMAKNSNRFKVELNPDLKEEKILWKDKFNCNQANHAEVKVHFQ